MSLLDMNPPEEGVDKFWIRQTEDIIAKTVRWDFQRFKEIFTKDKQELKFV